VTSVAELAATSESLAAVHSAVGDAYDFMTVPSLRAAAGVARAHFVVVSSAMRRALDGAGVKGLHYSPATLGLQHRDRVEQRAGYWLARVERVVPCLDVAVFTGAANIAPQDIKRINVIESRAQAALVFALVENSDVLLVDVAVAECLKRAKLRGLTWQRWKSRTQKRLPEWVAQLGRPRALFYGVGMGGLYLAITLATALHRSTRAWLRSRS